MAGAHDMTTHDAGLTSKDVFDPSRIERPDPALLTNYFIVSCLTLIAFPFVFLALFLKYKTLRYRIDGEGISMSWGALNKREIVLTYRRIQDIHVHRSLIQRHLGLASVAIQTASASTGAEMTIEGIRDPERLRDFLYERMRGASEGHDGDTAPGDEGELAESAEDEALALLREIRNELARVGEAREGAR